MKQDKSIIVTDADKQIAALKESRLSALIKDEATFNRIVEASVTLLTNDKLRACDELSILGALYKAATLGFRLEPEFGECYLIPRSVYDGQDEQGRKKYKSVCTFQIGYKGWKAKALESGHVSYISGRGVYTGDSFEFEYGTSGFLNHRPADTNNGVSTHFYALARLKDGSMLFEVINKQAAEKSRKNSETQYDWIGEGKNKQRKFSENPKGIWFDHYEPMALRVPIKKLCASLPLSPAVEAATMADGTVTYLQKDGTVTTISAVDVENNAEVMEAEIIPVKDAEKYLSTKDLLDSYKTIKDVVDFYVEFSKGENAKSLPFVQAFFDAAARVSNTTDDLTLFYEAAGDWKKTKDLVNILSQRKSEIVNGKL